MKFNDKYQISKEFESLFSFENENEEILHDAQMLMFKFISEIEKYRKIQGVTKKELSQKIGVSASYLTQIFSGDKKLNFILISKIQKALNIDFNISTKSNYSTMEIDEPSFLDLICSYKDKKGTWNWTKLNNLPNRETVYTKELNLNFIMPEENESYSLSA